MKVSGCTTCEFSAICMTWGWQTFNQMRLYRCSCGRKFYSMNREGEDSFFGERREKIRFKCGGVKRLYAAQCWKCFKDSLAQPMMTITNRFSR